MWRHGHTPFSYTAYVFQSAICSCELVFEAHLWDIKLILIITGYQHPWFMPDWNCMLVFLPAFYGSDELLFTLLCRLSYINDSSITDTLLEAVFKDYFLINCYETP